MTLFRKIGDWARGLDQTQRNAFYKIAAAIGGACVAFGLVSAEEVEAIFTVGGSVLTLAATLLAIPTSNLKKVEVIDKPVEKRFIGDDYLP